MVPLQLWLVSYPWCGGN